MRAFILKILYATEVKLKLLPHGKYKKKKKFGESISISSFFRTCTATLTLWAWACSYLWRIDSCLSRNLIDSTKLLWQKYFGHSHEKFRVFNCKWAKRAVFTPPPKSTLPILRDRSCSIFEDDRHFFVKPSHFYENSVASLLFYPYTC